MRDPVYGMISGTPVIKSAVYEPQRNRVKLTAQGPIQDRLSFARHQIGADTTEYVRNLTYLFAMGIEQDLYDYEAPSGVDLRYFVCGADGWSDPVEVSTRSD